VINLIILKSDIAKFARWAKTHFPKEVLCAMIGEKEDGGMLEVRYLTKPIIGDKEGVEYSLEQWRIVQEETRSGLSFIGTIHSHPNVPPPVSPSAYDIDNASGNEKVYGICGVWKEEGRLKTKIEFFSGGPELRVGKI
jgi:proteasome lid subunit RPN8/RPN11